MLFAFITANRDAIIERTRDRVRQRRWPSVSTREIDEGVPLFLTQLSETLRLEGTTTPFAGNAIGDAATRRGATLLAAGFDLAQIVHDYGDICQSITEIAIERREAITVEEFHTLHRFLDTAIAEAVTEHARLTARIKSDQEIERLGHAAHELRDVLNSAVLAFHALKRGAVAINGSTGAVLGRSLTNLQELINRTLSEVRLAKGDRRIVPLQMTTFIDEIAAVGVLNSEYREIQFTVEPVTPDLVLDADPQLLTSAIMNLLHNAFKNTHAGGTVTLSAHAVAGRLLIEVRDECGGIPETKGDLFQPFGERRGKDRSGLGLGLSIARKAARAHNGDITITNLPGTGCVFTIDLPLGARASA